MSTASSSSSIIGSLKRTQWGISSPRELQGAIESRTLANIAAAKCTTSSITHTSMLLRAHRCGDLLAVIEDYSLTLYNLAKCMKVWKYTKNPDTEPCNNQIHQLFLDESGRILQVFEDIKSHKYLECYLAGEKIASLAIDTFMIHVELIHGRIFGVGVDQEFDTGSPRTIPMQHLNLYGWDFHGELKAKVSLAALKDNEHPYNWWTKSNENYYVICAESNDTPGLHTKIFIYDFITRRVNTHTLELEPNRKIGSICLTDTTLLIGTSLWTTRSNEPNVSTFIRAEIAIIKLTEKRIDQIIEVFDEGVIIQMNYHFNRIFYLINSTDSSYCALFFIDMETEENKFILLAYDPRILSEAVRITVTGEFLNVCYLDRDNLGMLIQKVKVIHAKTRNIILNRYITGNNMRISLESGILLAPELEGEQLKLQIDNYRTG